jgi:hypothetical protein
MGWSGGTFTRTNGVFSGTGIWAKDRDAGTKITAAHHDTNDDDLATGINTCITKDGQNAFTGAADLGSQKITALGDGTAHTDGLNIGQVQDGFGVFQATDSGSANTYAIALSPAVTAYAAGQMFTFKAANANSGASTLNVNGLGTKDLKKNHDVALASGDIEQNALVTAVYDGTQFQVISQLGNAGGTMSSWTLSGDSGSNQSIADGNTVDIAGGTGIDTVASATDTVTVSVDSNVCMLNATANFADNIIQRPIIKDYGETHNAIGDTGGGTDAIDLSSGNVVSATVSTGTQTFTFTNPTASANGCSFLLLLTNGGSQTVNWPASVDWAGGTAPTLTASGTDILVFTTVNGGTLWHGAIASTDSK